MIQEEDTGKTLKEPKTTYEGYDQILESLKQAQEGNKKSQEDMRRRERLARSQAFVGGLSDFGRAMANLMATTEYAPNGYDEKQSLSPKGRERAERMRAERDKLKEQGYNLNLRMANASTDKERAMNNFNLQQYRLEQQQKDREAAQAAKEKEKEEKAAKETLAASVAARESGWKVKMYNNGFDYAREKGALEAEKDAGRLTDAEYAAYSGALERVNAEAAKQKYQNKQEIEKEQRAEARSRRGSESESSGNNYVYVDMGNGGGVNINKNDGNLGSVYNSLPQNAKYDEILTPNPTTDQMRAAIESYLRSGASEEDKEKVREALRQRSERRRENGGGKKKQNPMSSGTSAGSGKKRNPMSE